jgi:hypothetical protein
VRFQVELEDLNIFMFYKPIIDVQVKVAAIEKVSTLDNVDVGRLQ